MTDSTETPWRTTEEIAVLLRRHPNSIYRLVKLGQIPHKKVGNKLLFNIDDVDAWLHAR